MKPKLSCKRDLKDKSTANCELAITGVYNGKGKFAYRWWVYIDRWLSNPQVHGGISATFTGIKRLTVTKTERFSLWCNAAGNIYPDGETSSIEIYAEAWTYPPGWMPSFAYESNSVTLSCDKKGKMSVNGDDDGGELPDPHFR